MPVDNMKSIKNLRDGFNTIEKSFDKETKEAVLTDIKNTEDLIVRNEDIKKKIDSIFKDALHMNLSRQGVFEYFERMSKFNIGEEGFRLLNNLMFSNNVVLIGGFKNDVIALFFLELVEKYSGILENIRRADERPHQLNTIKGTFLQLQDKDQMLEINLVNQNGKSFNFHLSPSGAYDLIKKLLGHADNFDIEMQTRNIKNNIAGYVSASYNLISKRVKEFELKKTEEN